MRVSTGALLAAASATAYGCLGVFTKLAYAEGWSVPSLLTVRFGLAGAVLLPFALRGARASWRELGGGFLVGALGYTVTTALYFPSVRHLPAAVASFLLFLAPVFVALLARVLFQERLGARGVAALGLAVAGLALLASGAFTGALSVPGVLLAAGSAVTYSLTVLASRRLAGRVPWAQAAVSVCAGAAACYLTFSAATGRLAFPPSAAGWAYAAGIGIIATGLALGLFFMALPRIGASRTATIGTLEPVATLVLAAAFIGEIPPWTGILGGLLIVGAAGLVASAGDEPPPAPQPG